MSGRPLTICKWGQGEPSAEHDAAFMYKLSSNGERGVLGSGVSNVTIWEKWHAYICEISSFFCCCMYLLFLLILF